MDVENAVFAVAQEHQFDGARSASDLTAQLRADGATCARHQHALAVHQRRHLRRVDLHRLTAQQIFDLHVAKLPMLARAARATRTCRG